MENERNALNLLVATINNQARVSLAESEQIKQAIQILAQYLANQEAAITPTVSEEVADSE